METLAKKLNNLMEEKGFNYKSLSLAAGLGETSVRDIIVGRVSSPKISTIKKLAHILGVRPEYLTSDEAHIKSILKDENGEITGLLHGIQAVILALLSKKLLKQSDLEVLFNYRLRDFRACGQSNAAEVMNQLLDFVHSTPSLLSTPSSNKPPLRSPVQHSTRKPAGS